MPDEALRNVLTKKLGVLDLENVLNTTYLNLERNSSSEPEIKTLKGLELFVNLKQLYISKYGVTDISAVTSLKNLEYLSLPYNKISVLPDLSGLNLKSLNLSYNYLTADSLKVSLLPENLKLNIDYILSTQIRSIEPEIKVLDEYYLYNGKVPFQLEFHNQEVFDSTYNLEILEGNNQLLVAQSSGGNCISWYFDDISSKTGNGKKTLTFIVKNSNKEVICELTKDVTIGAVKTNEVFTGKYISVNESEVYVNARIYDQITRGSKYILYLIDNNNNVIARSSNAYVYDYYDYYANDIFYNGYDLKITYSSVSGNLKFAKKQKIGDYQLAYSVDGGIIIPLDAYVSITTEPTVKEVSFITSYPNVGKNIYISVSAVNTDFKKIYPVVINGDKECSNFVDVKLTNKNRAVYHLELTTPINTSNFMIKIKSTDNSYTFKAEEFYNLYKYEPLYYYAYYDNRENQVKILTTLPEGSMVKVYLGDDLTKDKYASKQLIVHNGKVEIGSDYDLSKVYNFMYTIEYDNQSNSGYLYNYNSSNELQDAFYYTGYTKTKFSAGIDNFNNNIYYKTSKEIEANQWCAALFNEDGLAVGDIDLSAREIDLIGVGTVWEFNLEWTGEPLVEGHYYIKFSAADKSTKLDIYVLEPNKKYASYIGRRYSSENDKFEIYVRVENFDRVDPNLFELVLTDAFGEPIDFNIINREYNERNNEVVFTLDGDFDVFTFKVSAKYQGDFLYDLNDVKNVFKSYDIYFDVPPIAFYSDNNLLYGVYVRNNNPYVVKIYNPYETNPLVTLNIKGSYNFTAYDLKDLYINNPGINYDIIILDSNGHFVSVYYGGLTVKSSYSLNASSIILNEKETFQLVTTLPESAIVEWFSDDPLIATVDNNGLVTAISEGSTYIRARYNGEEVICYVQVTAPISFERNVLFDVEYYLEKNPDLADIFKTESELYKHWLEYGIAEGRIGSRIFNAKYYLEKNPDLVAVLGNDYKAAYQHYIDYGCSEYRPASSEFNAVYYAGNYSDMVGLTGKELAEHYVKYGRAEGRIADRDLSAGTGEEKDYDPAEYSAIFDVNYYIANNPDIAAAIGSDTKQLLTHFIDYGMAEGRQGSAEFNVWAYRKYNPDLVAVFGDDLAKYYMHYKNFGKNEGRIATEKAEEPKPEVGIDPAEYSAIFDVNYYIANNPDIAAAIGSDTKQLLAHFINYGMAEGRQGSAKFNVWVYQKYNPDLVNAFGGNLKEYYLHYNNYGVYEGRIAAEVTPPSSENYDSAYYAAVFDAESYAYYNPDLMAVLGNDTGALLKHFVDYGMAEGRQGSATFNVYRYIANNPDLVSAFGNNLKEYYMHYINYGRAEGRIGY